MAELCVMVADVLAGKAGEDVDTFDEKSKLRYWAVWLTYWKRFDQVGAPRFNTPGSKRRAVTSLSKKTLRT